MVYLLVAFLLAVLVLPILAFAPTMIHNNRFHSPTTPRVVYSGGTTIQILRKNPVVATRRYDSFDSNSESDDGYLDDDDEYFDYDKELSEEDIKNVIDVAVEFGNQNLINTLLSEFPERLKTFRSEYPFLFEEMRTRGGDEIPEIPGSVYYALQCYNENPRKAVPEFFESKELKVLYDKYYSSNNGFFTVCLEWEWDLENGYKNQYHATVPPLEMIDCVYRSDIPFTCGDIVLANRTQDGIQQFANEIVTKLGSGSELTAEEMEERAINAVYNPQYVFTEPSDTEDFKDIPSVVWEACIAYYITESVDAVETIIGDNTDVKLSVRSTKNETLGNYCILECDREGNRANEYYIVPNTNIDPHNLLPYDFADQRFLSVVKNERQDIPVQWKNIASIPIRASRPFILALALAKIMKVPNFGFGEGFSVIPSVMLSKIRGIFTNIRLKSLFTTTEEGRFILACAAIGIIPPLILLLISDTDFDVDDIEWITKLPSSALASFEASISYLGTRAGPFVTLLSAFLIGALPGVAEELLFRGVLQTVFTRWFGLSLALPLQAVLFGIWHRGYQSKAYMALTGSAGFLLGAIFSRTGNLAIPMLMHAANNMSAALFFHSIIKTFTAIEIYDVLSRHRHSKNKLSQDGDAVAL